MLRNIRIGAAVLFTLALLVDGKQNAFKCKSSNSDAAGEDTSNQTLLLDGSSSSSSTVPTPTESVSGTQSSGGYVASQMSGSSTSRALSSSQSSQGGSSNSAPIWNWVTQKAYGVNLGNWLILEAWMDSSWFWATSQGGSDEWGLSQNLGKDKASQTLEQHWQNWIKEDDIARLASFGINMLRVPVGFWAFMDTYDSEPYVTKGQKAHLERLMTYMDKYNMYIILDLHGMPGSQNGQDHSGHAGDIHFFESDNINRALQALHAMTDWCNTLPNKNRIAAIEAANEPHPYTADRWTMLTQYYQDAYKIISAGGFAMMFHDGFQGLDKWSGFFRNGENVVIDLHPYWAFSGNQTKDKVIAEVCQKGAKYGSYHIPVFAGEFSVAATSIKGDVNWYKKFYASQQSQWRQSAGGTFWSLRSINSDPWSWEALVNMGAITQNVTDLSASAC